MRKLVSFCDYRVPNKDGEGFVSCGREGHVVAFTAEGVAYRADLCDKHEALLNRQLSKFVMVAHATGLESPETLRDMRQWLREHGHDVAERGRIPDTLKREYLEMHNP